MAISTEMTLELQDLIDRDKINQCLLRYARGVDRLDEELILSAFHADAIDFHAKGRCGSAKEFLGWWLPTQAHREVAQHYVTNGTIDIDGDMAHVESYFLALMKTKGQDATFLTGGRYTDRMEKRGGEWKIALRLVHISGLSSARPCNYRGSIPSMSAQGTELILRTCGHWKFPSRFATGRARGSHWSSTEVSAQPAGLEAAVP